jgi:hypothetical protein
MLASLAAARSNIAAETTEMRTLGFRPEDAARGAQLRDALRDQVAALAHREIGSLSADAGGRAAQAESLLGGGDAARTTAAYASVRRSGAALATLSQSATADPADMLALGRRMLVEYGAFNQVYGEASRLFLPARRQAFEAVRSQASAAAERVISAANVAKPWFFASQARKQAYQRLQTNASQARAVQTQLVQLSRSAATATAVGVLNDDILQAAGMIRELDALDETGAAATDGAGAADRP